MYAVRESLTTPSKGFKVNKYVKFVLGIVLLFSFVTVGLPNLSKFVGFSKQHQVIIDEKIEAGAWFYIFVEQIREIEPRVTHSLKYSPGMNVDSK